MTRGTHTRGMTLIELLVAISVSTMVFAASVSLYMVITASILRQQERRHEAGAAALDQIRHDLAGCAQAPFSNMPPFKVESPAHDTNAPGLCSLEFFVGSIPLPEDDFSKLEIHRIRYSVTDASVLMRESVSLWGTDALGPATSNGVLEGVTAWEVSVLTESGWTNQWTSSARRLFPQAARLRLDWRTASTTETATVEVFIPAGNGVGGGALSF
jgi:type II secretion system protein J